MTVLLPRYYYSNQIEKEEMGRAAHGKHGGIEECIQEFGGKPEEMRPLRRPRHR
jgi:hypothetical protein